MPSNKESALHAMYKKEPQLFNYAIVATILVAIALVFTFAHVASSGVSQCGGILLSAYKYGCISTLAISSNNYTLCSGLPSQYADSCFSTIAVKTQNDSLCSRLSTSQEMYDCAYEIANQSGSYSACSTLPESMQPMCFTSVGVGKANAGACKQIANASDSEICNYSVQLRSVLNANNPAECATIINNTNSALTANVAAYSGIYQYSGPSGQNISVAEAVSGYTQQPIGYVQFLSGIPFSPRDLCYLYFAPKTGNAAYCSYVSNSTLSNLCSESVQSRVTTSGNQQGLNASALGNLTAIPPAECENLSLSENTCNALSKIYNAITTRNQTACARLAGLFQYQCYSSMARVYENSTYCGYINNASANSACVDDIYFNNTT